MALQWLFVLFICFPAIEGQNCATPSLNLTELPKRSRNIILDTNTAIVEDRYLSEDWYSVPIEGLPNKQYLMTDNTAIPDPFSCSTYYPVYIKGPHPELAEGEEIQVDTCEVDFFSNCANENKISVRRCNGKYEYKLKATSANSAYCFDREDIDEPGVAAPDQSVVTKASVEVALQYEDVHELRWTIHKPYLEFYCSFQNTVDYFYYVDWYANDVHLLQRGPVNTAVKESTKLQEAELVNRKYTLGISIKCGVTVARSASGMRTEPIYSDGFFAGIKIHHADSKLNLLKGEVGSVVLENTVPVGCQGVSIRQDDDCFVSIQMFDPSSTYSCEHTTLAALSDSRLCGVDLTGVKYKAWNDFNNGIPCDTCGQSFKVTMNIITKNDAKYEDENTYTLKLITGSTKHSIWANYDIADVTVIVQNDNRWARKVCYSHVDPHMCTADGMLYENQQSGDFWLYKNTAYDIWIQERTIPCNGAFCTCSATVRAGGDVFHFSVCSDNLYINFLKCEDHILDVRRINDNKYQVHTPIGTYLEIRRIKWGRRDWLNLDIMMSPKDLNNVEGLCGVFNGDIKDDLLQNDGVTFPDSPCGKDFCRYDAKRFASTWLVQEAELLRNLRKDTVLNNWPTAQTFCVCPYIKYANGSTILPIPDGENERNNALCSPSELLTCTRKVILDGTKKECTISRRRRSVNSHYTELQHRFQMENAEPKNLKKRSNGVTNGTIEQGLEICRSFLDAQSIYQQYASSMPVSIATDAMLSDCASDYMLGQLDEELMLIHLDGWVSMNLNEIKRNETYASDNTAAVNGFRSSVCPYNCREQGTCSEGQCQCNTGFGGDDCSVVVSDPVHVQYIGGGNLCDKDLDECDLFSVQAENILSSVRCKVEEVQIFADGTHSVLKTSIFAGERDSIFLAYCRVPTLSKRKKRSTSSIIHFITQYNLYISNDGSTFGDSGTVYVYDSECQTYVEQSTGQLDFSLKDGFCYIEGTCQVSGNVKSSDSCYVCSPNIDAYKWTSICVESSPVDGNNLTPTIVALSVGVPVLVIVAVVAVIMYKKCNKKQRCATPDINARTRLSQKRLDTYFEASQPPPYVSTTDLQRPSSSNAMARAQTANSIQLFVTDFTKRGQQELENVAESKLN